MARERTSRDFVPWRFSDAGYRSAWLDRRCRRPKTCTQPDSCTAANDGAMVYSITSSALASSVGGTVRPSAGRSSR